ncbi:MAG: tetratricopeptide repeat protein, partial [Gemmatimonadales bacterium]
GITERRATLAARAATVRAESSAAQPAYEPAIAAYRAYLEAYPEATDAVPGLASLFYQSGRVADAEAGFAAIYPRDEPVDPDVALDAGRGALRANLFAVAAQLLTRGLEGRPFNRDGLVDLATSYLALRDSVRLLAAAQRLAAVDPLNRTTLRLLAAGWDLRDKGDSARKYQDLAGGGLQVEIAIATFLADSAGFRLTGVAGNGGSTPSRAQRVTFEFLDAQGTAQVTQAIDIPSIPPRGTHRIEIRVPGQGLVAWRYRPS